jgi:AcrR family transcriptional regulator
VKAERTRQYILEKAAPLFNQKGFDGTSLADLEKVTGLTKGALYGNFSDKTTLAGEAFRYSVRKVRYLARQSLLPFNSQKAKLFALLDFFAQYVMDPPIAGGCPLLNTAIEADDHRVDMRPVVAEELVSVVNLIASLLRKGVQRGEFRKDINPRELAYTFFCAIEGAIMFSRVEGSREPMKIIVSHCKNKLDQISNSVCSKEG